MQCDYPFWSLYSIMDQEGTVKKASHGGMPNRHGLLEPSASSIYRYQLSLTCSKDLLSSKINRSISSKFKPSVETDSTKPMCPFPDTVTDGASLSKESATSQA